MDDECLPNRNFKTGHEIYQAVVFLQQKQSDVFSAQTVRGHGGVCVCPWCVNVSSHTHTPSHSNVPDSPAGVMVALSLLHSHAQPNMIRDI